MKRSSFSTPSSGRGKVFRNSRFNSNNKSRNGGKKHGQYIDPKRFVKAAVQVEEAVVFEPQHTFADFGFNDAIQSNLKHKGYVHPTPIQDASIPVALKGGDVIGLANTGTGKTAAFMLPIINQLVNDNSGKTALVMAPTRELAVQIDDEFKAFARGLKIYSALCVGGVSINRQVEQLRRRPQVVIGTPGRLKDLLNQKVLKLDRVGFLVLDEADRMLDMGFIRDIRYILDRIPANRQSLCFSATITPEIQRLLDEMLVDPVKVQVQTNQTSDNIEQNVIEVTSKDEKARVLQDLLAKEEFDRVLVFGQTKWGVQRLADDLNKAGFTAEAIHGNKSQPQRQKALRAFKSGKATVMVATDVAARGLDIPAVSHVINFDEPATYDDYIHRIGRTGRAGKQGHALTFVTTR